MNPYNHNPFEVATSNDSRSEYDANRQLKETAEQRITIALAHRDRSLMIENQEYYLGVARGIQELATFCGVALADGVNERI